MTEAGCCCCCSGVAEDSFWLLMSEDATGACDCFCCCCEFSKEDMTNNKWRENWGDAIEVVADKEQGKWARLRSARTRTQTQRENRVKQRGKTVARRDRTANGQDALLFQRQTVTRRDSRTLW